jgi:hypothetical protein
MLKFLENVLKNFNNYIKSIFKKNCFKFKKKTNKIFYQKLRTNF